MVGGKRTQLKIEARKTEYEWSVDDVEVCGVGILLPSSFPKGSSGQGKLRGTLGRRLNRTYSLRSSLTGDGRLSLRLFGPLPDQVGPM